MKRYWVRWHSPKPLDEFEYHGPWWISGLVDTGLEETVDICVAAVQAASIDEAQAVIVNAYDDPKPSVVFDFTNERADDWSPFCDRFKRADWMKWPFPLAAGSTT